MAFSLNTATLVGEISKFGMTLRSNGKATGALHLIEAGRDAREHSSYVNNELPRSKLRGINPPLADSYGPPVWRGKAGVSCVGSACEP